MQEYADSLGAGRPFPAVCKRTSPERNQCRLSFETVAAKAKESVLQDGQQAPLLIVQGSRTLAMGQIHDMPDAHCDRLEQVFVVSEGWMSAATKEKPLELRPCQHPHRKEVLLVSGLEMRGFKIFLPPSLTFPGFVSRVLPP
jgi:hypothetical protein